MGLRNQPETDELREIASGNEEAFERLYDQYQGLVYSIASAILRSDSEAEDLTQEVFLRLWDRAGDLGHLNNLAAWITTTARNRSIDRLRKSNRAAKTKDALEGVATEVSGSVGVAEAIISREQATEVRKAVNQLEPGRKEVIELSFYAGLSQTEIASSLNLPLGTVKSRIRRGMLDLRQPMMQLAAS